MTRRRMGAVEVTTVVALCPDCKREVKTCLVRDYMQLGAKGSALEGQHRELVPHEGCNRTALWGPLKWEGLGT